MYHLLIDLSNPLINLIRLSIDFYIYAFISIYLFVYLSIDLSYQSIYRSLEALQAGTWPDRNWDGTEFVKDSRQDLRRGTYLADGFRCVLWTVSGDLEWFKQWLDFPHWNAHSPCGFCRCTLRSRTNVLSSAAWTASVYTSGCRGDSKCPLFLISGVDILTVKPDYMHNKHMGTDMWFIGSIFHVLVTLLGRPMDYIWDQINVEYTKDDDRFSNIVKSMWHRGPNMFPCLKGKAAEVKDLVRPLQIVFAKEMDATKPEHVIMNVGLKASAHMDEIIDQHKSDAVLPPESATKLRETIFCFLRCTAELRAFYGAEFLFPIPFKFHQLAHIALRAHELNPRWAWCYLGESFMHELKVLVQGSVTSTRPSHVGNKVTKKWAAAWAFSQIEHRNPVL